MEKRLALGLVSGLLAVLVTGAAMAAELVTVVRGKTRFSNRILFVCDVSGSMHGRSFDQAVSSVRALASQPTDDMQIGVIAFADTATRWSPSKKATWAKLPDAKAVKKAGAFLYRQGPGGGTNVVPALELALKETKGKLSIILITDGIFSETDVAVLKAIKTGQAKRKKDKRGEAVIAVLGVGTKQKVLEKLGRAGKGGYYRTAK